VVEGKSKLEISLNNSASRRATFPAERERLNMSIKKLEQPVFCILYKDALLRKGRMDNCDPQTFNTEQEAEEFILNYRASLIECGTPAKRWDFYLFSTDTNLGRVQGA
jgi:hypothetical protein